MVTALYKKRKWATTSSRLLCTLVKRFPFLFQNGPLHGVLINRIAVGIVNEGHEFHEHAFLAHAQLLAEVLAGQVVVLSVGIDPAGALLMEQVIKERMSRFEGITLTLVGGIQHPAGTEGVLYIVFRRIRLGTFRMLLLSWVVGAFQYNGLERKSNGFFYLTTVGDFRPAHNGDSRPVLTQVFQKAVNQFWLTAFVSHKKDT